MQLCRSFLLSYSTNFIYYQPPLSPLLPIVVFFAVYAAVLAEAGEFGLQVELAFTAFEAAHVPLLVHGQKVVTVRNLPAAARAQSHAFVGHAGHGLRRAPYRGKNK